MGNKDVSDAEFERFERFLDEWSRRDFLRGMGGAAAFTAFMAGGMELLLACGPGGGTGAPTQEVKKGGHVTEAIISDLRSFNGVLTSDTVSSSATSMIYDSLYTQDPKGNLFPLLAKEAPKTASDGLTYTITLRDGMKWTDGKEITADDVKLTYDFMIDPQYEKVNSPRRGELTEYVNRVTVKDAKTVVFEMKKVNAGFPTLHMQYNILPKHIWGTLTSEQVNTTELNSKPVVTSGMFKDVNWQKDQQVTFQKNPNYYRGAPNLDSYVMRVVKSSTEILNMLKTGEADWGILDPAQVDAAKAVDTIAVKNYPGLVFTFYMYNLDPAKSKLFQEREVRQAMLYAVDREAIVKSIYFGYGTVANTTMPPPSWAYNKDNKPVYTFDKAKANQMLDAAGWQKGADGLRAKAGQKLQFKMITNAGNKARESTLQAMQQMWKDIGVDATPEFVDFNKVLVPAIQNTRDFQLLLVGFQWNADPDQASVFHSRNSRPGGFNGMSYKNADVDKILDDAIAQLDQGKRKDLYFKLQQKLAEDVPAPILNFPDRVLGINKRVQNFTASTFTNEYAGRVHYLKDVFVSDAK